MGFHDHRGHVAKEKEKKKEHECKENQGKCCGACKKNKPEPEKTSNGK